MVHLNEIFVGGHLYILLQTRWSSSVVLRLGICILALVIVDNLLIDDVVVFGMKPRRLAFTLLLPPRLVQALKRLP